ncbi:MAG TPA: hypothetical protein VM935_14430 [Chitinophagaceae bacterium]|nr:hypothetical protein [Chitinophagaceae bacterium]
MLTYTQEQSSGGGKLANWLAGKLHKTLPTPHTFLNLFMLQPLKYSSELIDGIRCRDAHCLDSFYNYYSTVIFSLITRDIHDREEAEKLMENVFCKIAESISTYNSGDRFFTWVIQLTQKEIQGFISLRNERQKKIDAVIANLFYMQSPARFTYAAS